MKINDVSRITISGGCEVYAEGGITFTPSDKDTVRVKLANSGGHFYDDNNHLIPSFEIKVSAEQLSVFIKEWVALIKAVKQETDYLNTRNASVLIDLSLASGRIHFAHAENEAGYQLDPIIDAIERFVAVCHQKMTAPASADEQSPVSPMNKTAAFLGAMNKRNEVILQFSDMNGLHGGRLVVVTGAGNVLVQTVFPDRAKQAMWEKRYTFDLSGEQLDAIFAALIDNDILTIQLDERPGVPDEVLVRFSMTNAAGKTFNLEDWERASLPPDAYADSPRARFDKACLVIKKLVHVAEKQHQPVQEGPYVGP